jgi:hypothetical protein
MADEATTPRSEPPVAAGELDALLGELERVRSYLRWKCGGLDADGSRQALPPSTMTLGGLLKHLALVEDHVFGLRLHGRELPEPWRGVDWDADPDWEWRTAAEESPEELLALWETAVARSRVALAEALADGGLDHLAAPWPDGRRPNARRLVLDMIEEYGRHVGHADLIRESVDGLVGEDPS